MRLILQRVTSGKVSVDGQTIASIGPGMVILLGIAPGDDEAQARSLAEKVAHLRIFEDEEGKMNRSIPEARQSLYRSSRCTRTPAKAAGRLSSRPPCQTLPDRWWSALHPCCASWACRPKPGSSVRTCWLKLPTMGQ